MFFRKQAAKRSDKTDTQAVLECISHTWNSSMQNPVLAHHHNRLNKEANLQTGARPHFLNLPVNARKIIYEIALNDPEYKIVITGNLELSTQPPLTMVCRDIRQEALPVYYHVNVFQVIIKDYYIRPYLRWYEQVMRHHSEETPVWIQFAIPENTIPNFGNLVEWLELAHQGRVAALDEEHSVEGKKHSEVMKGVFATVMGLKDEPFGTVDAVGTVERILPGIQATLGAMDARWLMEKFVSKKAQAEAEMVAAKVQLEEELEEQVGQSEEGKEELMDEELRHDAAETFGNDAMLEIEDSIDDDAGLVD